MKFQVFEKIMQEKLVAVIRASHAEEAINITQGAYEGGISLIELTFTTPNALAVLKQFQNKPILLGAGTVLDHTTARLAILEGAQFIVSPTFDEETAKICNLYSIPYFPGTMTISEISKALQFGCDIVKLFPANNFNPSIINAIKGPLPNIEIMPTGGISLGNLSDWIEAGACAVGIGSDLNRAFTKGGIQAVTDVCQQYIQVINEWRTKQ